MTVHVTVHVMVSMDVSMGMSLDQCVLFMHVHVHHVHVCDVCSYLMVSVTDHLVVSGSSPIECFSPP